MAAKKRSQEEKNLKILRELASLPVNKQCFDCHQRGPTYVNMTVGSFVCTSCSGMLRGLNPPHRVKSITMTVFTPDEIDFIRSRGNEYCRYVWLGTYDARSSFLEPEPRDEQKVKDFMIQKYERKRWYVEPEKASRNMLDRAIEESSQMNSNTSSQGSTPQSEHVPETKALASLLGRNPTPLVIQRTQVPTNSWVNHVNSTKPLPNSQKRLDSFESSDMFLGLSSTGNSSVPAAQTTNSASYSVANGNFANFESAFNDSAPVTNSGNAFGNFDSTNSSTFPAFGSDAPMTSASSNGSTLFSPPPQKITQPVGNLMPDRYAALADLDILFHQDPVTSTPAPAPVPAWTGAPATTVSSNNNNNNSSSLFINPQQPAVNAFLAAAPANPFTSTTATWSGNPSSPNPFQTANPVQTSYSQQSQMYPPFGGNQVDNYSNLGQQQSAMQQMYPAPYQNSTNQFGMNGVAYPFVGPTQGSVAPISWGMPPQMTGHFQNAKLGVPTPVSSSQPVQSSVNPFMNNQVSNSLRTNPSNPFL